MSEMLFPLFASPTRRGSLIHKLLWFSPFLLGSFPASHSGDTSIPQEFYRWPLVASAAKAAISIRYRLMDYIYTSLHLAQTSGHPVLEPLHFIYPSDSNTFGNEHQFFYGPHLLVSPVVDENATSVEIYLPDDLFYQFHTLSPVRGQGKNVTLDNVGFDEIPLHLRGGAIVPLRASSGMTTDEVRNKPFHLVVAPGLDDKASGSLYLDDGVSIEPDSHSYISMEYENQRLSVSGRFGYEPKSNKVTKVVFLNQDEMKKVHVGGKEVERDRVEYDHENKTLTITGLDIALERAFTIRLE